MILIEDLMSHVVLLLFATTILLGGITVTAVGGVMLYKIVRAML